MIRDYCACERATNRVFLLLAVFVLLSALEVFCLPTFPTPEGFITDRANILTTSEKVTVEEVLSRFAKETSNEVAVLIVPSLGGISVEEYANKVFHQWGIGNKYKDNGVLFLWSVGDHKVRIEVGYGLEQVITDGEAGRIVRNITAQFKRQEWADGVYTGVSGITMTILNQAAVGNVPTQGAQPIGGGPDGETILLVLFSVLVVGGGIFGIVALVRWSHREEDEVERRAQRINSWSRAQETYRQPTYTQRVPDAPAPMSYTPTPVVVVEHVTRRDDDDSYSRRSSFDSSSSSGDSFGGSSFGGFSGGDSGGAGASGDY
jgi:uncharacterized protein